MTPFRWISDSRRIDGSWRLYLPGSSSQRTAICLELLQAEDKTLQFFFRNVWINSPNRKASHPKTLTSLRWPCSWHSIVKSQAHRPINNLRVFQRRYTRGLVNGFGTLSGVTKHLLFLSHQQWYVLRISLLLSRVAVFAVTCRLNSRVSSWKLHTGKWMCRRSCWLSKYSKPTVKYVPADGEVSFNLLTLHEVTYKNYNFLQEKKKHWLRLYVGCINHS